MLDDLRNSASTPVEPLPEEPSNQSAPRRPRREPLLGMSPGQRFVVVLLLFMMTCVLGAGCLILTGKVYLPFF